MIIFLSKTGLIRVLVLAALLLVLMTIEWIFIWCITLLNDQRY